MGYNQPSFLQAVIPMTEDQKKRLETQLWNIANDLRGKMNADEFRGLLPRFHLLQNTCQTSSTFTPMPLWMMATTLPILMKTVPDGKDMLQAIKDESVTELGYFLKPSELFSSLAKRATDAEEFILGDLTNVLNGIERSTMGTESEDDFDHLFEDLEFNLNQARA